MKNKVKITKIKLSFYTLLSIFLVVGSGIYFIAKYLRDKSIQVFANNITNITANSATIIWYTDKPVVGSVVLEFEQNGKMLQKIFVDRRDENNGVLRQKRYTHYITLTNLSPDTKYTYKIKNGMVLVNPSLFNTIQTAKETASNINTPMPFYGEIKDSFGYPLDDGIMVMELADNYQQPMNKQRSILISTLVTQGTYSVDINEVYNADLTRKFIDSIEDGNYYVTMQVFAPDHKYVYTSVTTKDFQPLFTIEMEKGDLFASYMEYMKQNQEQPNICSSGSLIGQVSAACASHCVGNCQGCNDGECAKYGCGYMEYCCGTQEANDDYDAAEDECSGHCGNGKQDCDETGTDCGGGGCHTCGYNADGTPQKGTDTTKCTSYDTGEEVTPNPVTKNCTCAVDGIKNSDETAVDCGGAYCPSCTDNAGSHCFNGKKDADEEGVDCNGSCAAQCAKANAAAQAMGSKCTNTNEIMPCSDMADWYCWCESGRIKLHHRKDVQANYVKGKSKNGQEKNLTGKYGNIYGASSKIGINFATEWLPEDFASYLQQTGASSALFVLNDDSDGLTRMKEIISKIPEDSRDGFTFVVRPCAGDSCDFTDKPEDFVAAVEQLYEAAQEAGVNLAVSAGPNEEETWACGDQKGECSTNKQLLGEKNGEWMATVADGLEDYSLNDDFILGTGSFNVTSPNLNEYSSSLFTTLENYGITSEDYETVMMNSYNLAGYSLCTTIMECVERGQSVLPDIPITLTEIGAFDTPENPNYDNYITTEEARARLEEQIAEISESGDIALALLFNPGGTSTDESQFGYANLPIEFVQEVVETATTVEEGGDLTPSENTFTMEEESGEEEEAPAVDIPVEDIESKSFHILPRVFADDEITVQSSGVYKINGVTVTGGFKEINIILNKEGEDVKVKFYHDLNGNKQKDSEETYIETASISLEKVGNMYKYTLTTGWNLIAFPFAPDSIETSVDLFEAISAAGGYATHISTYQDGRWYISTRRGETDYSDAINIIPGVGYYVKVHKATTLNISGMGYSGSIPVFLQTSWNLVGIYGDKKTYTAQSLIDNADKNNISIDIVSEWKNSKYNSYIKQEDETYGNDFEIDPYKGYFVRNQSAATIYTPN